MALLPIFGLASVLLALGARLVRSGLRSRGVELWLGCFFVTSGLSMPVRFALASGAPVAADAGTVNLGCQALFQAGVCCLAGFVWRTFRAAERVGRAVFLGIVAVLCGNLLLFAFTGAHALEGTPIHLLQGATVALVFTWAFVESAAYHARIRRRAALDLADPVVANRFLLWMLWTGGLAILAIVVTAVRVVERVESGGGGALGTAAPWTLAAIRTTVIAVAPVIAGPLWLSFFPPRGYREWIRSRHALRS